MIVVFFFAIQLIGYNRLNRLHRTPSNSNFPGYISDTTKFVMAEAVEKYVSGETESAVDKVLSANKESHVLLIYVRGNW